ncbi:class I adenylate-forming enzyme family protein [Nocardioides sp. YIM 152315]|uniref:class I adenylate-forming enzyme family protein n=1 Tax=Nocardioides sp. YIM 152315 TaxID=3031760 RepID=UPI0023DB2C96|nr:class I adenylate-forming enzyme family protein [Nocardioides sp. YIM 152315]MDF1602246.1 class I adenylate-forming enzyme family protein [Nocardioides sp. YIM 152315]
MNLLMLLEMVAQADPDRIAVTAGDRNVTYGELLRRASELAVEIHPDDAAAAYLGENSPEAVALLFAASMRGVPYAPINYRWTDTQINEAIGRIAPVSVLTDQNCSPRVRTGPAVRRMGRTGATTAIAVTPDQDAPGVLLFTSGTTSAPKAAVLRNRHLVPYVLDTIDFLGAGADEAILVSVPPYHIAAVSSVLTSVYSGRRMVQLASFEPDEWVRTARSERITQAMVVPTMLNRILDVIDSDGGGLPDLRHLSYGGGRMPAAVVERAMRLLPTLNLVNAYGLTETSSTITLLSPEDHRIAASSTDPAVRARLGSVGRALPSVEIEIRDETGSSLPAGRSGEIFVRGDQVSGEYLSHQATDAEGWYPTRDRGYLDGAGFLFLEGRADDVIVRGGENLSPAQIEDRLVAHPAVADAAVIGVPDLEWGERVEGFVVLDDEAVRPEALQEWVRAELRSSKVPAQIHVVDALPYNETGKVLRRELRARLAHEGALG